MEKLLSKVALTLLLLSIPLCAQTALSDWGGTTATYARHYTATPGICFPGQIFINDTTGQMIFCNAGSTWTVLNATYDVHATYNSTPGASAVGVRFVTARAFNSPVHTNSTTSPAKALVAATAQTDFVWAKNGTPFCTMRFAGSATTSTYQSCSSTSFAVGDILTVTSPGSPDATLANVGLTLPGILQ